MEKDIEEKRKRNRKSRERRSNKGSTKHTKFEYDEINDAYSVTDRNVHLPSAPSLNQINHHQYGKSDLFAFNKILPLAPNRVNHITLKYQFSFRYRASSKNTNKHYDSSKTNFQ